MYVCMYVCIAIQNLRAFKYNHYTVLVWTYDSDMALLL